MVRMRMAVILFLAGLALACGCSTLSNHPWFNRNRSQAVEGMGCEVGAPYPASGAMMDPAAGPYLAPPASAAAPIQTGPPPQVLQQNPGQAPGRFTPQAQPTPFTPAPK